MGGLRALIYREIAATWRYRWVMVAFAWLFCAAGWVVVSRIPNQYEASARLYVDADAVLTPLLRGIAVDTRVVGQLDILQRTLLSRPNLEKLISKTDLELGVTGPADLELLVTRLATDIKLQPQTKDLFTITYRNASAKLAYDVVRTVVTTFIESTSGTSRSDMENARQFLQTQIAVYEKQLREAETKRAEFKAKYVDLLPADGGATGLEVAQAKLRSLQGQLEDANQKSTVLKKELTDTSPLLVTETDAAGGPGGAGRLAEAQRALQELRLKYTDQHPDVIAARNLVAALKSSGGGEPATPRTPARSRSLPNPVFEQLKVRMVENDSVIGSLTRQVTDATAERDRLAEIARSAPGLQAEYVNLNRDYDVLRKNYEELLARRESMRIATAAETGAEKVKLQIIDPPLMPRNPIAPKRVLLIAGVLLAGLGGGIAAAVLLVRFDASFRSLEDMSEFGLPVVGGISLQAAATSLRARLLRVATVAIPLLALCAVCAGLLYRVLQTTGAA